MKIFISWSGQESKQVALLLKGWLKKVLQASEPWMSDADIVPGTRWSQTIASELQNSDFGIICVTPANRSAEWINFEAGALSIAIGETDRKVVPLLIGFEGRNAVSTGPLGVFNAVLFTKEDIWKLVLALNAELNVSVDAQDLAELFELFWPQLDQQVQALRTSSPASTPDPPNPNEMLKEILDLVRSMQADLVRSKQPDTSTLGYRDLLPLILGASLTPAQNTQNIQLLNLIRENLASHSIDTEARSKPTGLTQRERTIANLAQKGKSNRDIAKELNISTRTVEGHLYQIFTKLGVTNRSDLKDEILDRNSPPDDED
ncbi:DNA-binding CsgD family transcriptional regulator [Pseudarthrobacter oxydans]|uniref:DNA-binding CsgD family transcriptional regulator n=1 Tax=Pseudarthrobacter oxydans TaxID=1671 RepID=A0AAW8NBV4_PSEOX|nr:LuxR C-terminal-related transcriptional regulator [Pseudarthrobacter oxydans]MDR6793609.1 DNA-binding CsgD family transcriptional regulator [Pseudarthrobacter oxydans]MDR7165067.1 DNA-binding CsgD family transcriptional regulator [Pseudarthrobacter oxydans]